MKVGLYTLILSVVGSAAFGAVVGKIVDAFLLSRVNERFERGKWLRQVKFEAFANLSEEILAWGIKSGVADNPWRFRALGAGAILLIEDKNLINEINGLISDV
ncbi:hypothetical protein IBX73_08525 [candidate division WOR-3 bacterium]|nr:hypothetical protein [candidate division WOR-3 bacterium]